MCKSKKQRKSFSEASKNSFIRVLEALFVFVRPRFGYNRVEIGSEVIEVVLKKRTKRYNDRG